MNPRKSTTTRGAPLPFTRQARHTPQFKSVIAQPKIGVTAQSVRQPAAPPVYRPQQLPKVLQTKSALPQNAQSGKAQSYPVASQVHRSEGMKTGQPKTTTAQSSPLRKLPVAPAIHRPQAGSIQCKPAEVRVTGITHIVATRPGSRSIYGGEERREVTAHDRIVVETSARIRSRRGPNQETFDAYDRLGNRIYRWYLVHRLNGTTLDTPHYIREDTFEFVREHDRPRVSTDLPRRDRRTRQSHKLIRLEAWYNKDRELDQSGHMILYDYERRTYREYAIGPQQFPPFQMWAPLDEESGLNKYAFGAPPAKYHDVRTSAHQEKESLPRSLNASERPSKRQLEYMRAQTRKKNQQSVRRFDSVMRCDLLVTQEEYEYMLNLFALRLAVGHYNFVYEAQSVSNPFATRCLSMVEDLASLRQLVLRQDYADRVLLDFILKSTIDVWRAKIVDVDRHIEDVSSGRI